MTKTIKFNSMILAASWCIWEIMLPLKFPRKRCLPYQYPPFCVKTNQLLCFNSGSLLIASFTDTHHTVTFRRYIVVAEILLTNSKGALSEKRKFSDKSASTSAALTSHLSKIVSGLQFLGSLNIMRMEMQDFMYYAPNGQTMWMTTDWWFRVFGLPQQQYPQLIASYNEIHHFYAHIANCSLSMMIEYNITVNPYTVLEQLIFLLNYWTILTRWAVVFYSNIRRLKRTIIDRSLKNSVVNKESSICITFYSQRVFRVFFYFVRRSVHSETES